MVETMHRHALFVQAWSREQHVLLFHASITRWGKHSCCVSVVLSCGGLVDLCGCVQTRDLAV